MYVVNTIGALGDAVPAPVVATRATMDVGLLVGTVVGGVALGVLGSWVFARATKKRKKR